MGAVAVADRVIFANAHFVAADKPSGWLSVPSRFAATDPRPCLGTELEKSCGARLWPVHRLDVEVSGLVLFALSAEAHRAANGWFEEHRVEKIYEALCEGDATGISPGQQWTWRSHLLRGKRRAYESPAGKLATTLATYAGEKNGWLHFTLRPQTGRPHQLRYHLSAHGYPIAGDVLYGAARPFAAGGIGLRAVRLGFSGVSEAGIFELGSALEVEGF